MFKTGDGHDRILKFGVNLDKIRIGSGADSFRNLTLTRAGSDTVISVWYGTIRPEEVARTKRDADDFLFV